MRAVILISFLIISFIVIVFIFTKEKGGNQIKYNIKKNNEDYFMTKYEYGKLLYENPRGISCKKCHGKKGKGKLIATFTHTHKKNKIFCKIKTKDITNLSFLDFAQRLNPNYTPKNKNKDDICKKITYGKIMPKYYLSYDEINAIYTFLTKY